MYHIIVYVCKRSIALMQDVLGEVVETLACPSSTHDSVISSILLMVIYLRSYSLILTIVNTLKWDKNIMKYVCRIKKDTWR